MTATVVSYVLSAIAAAVLWLAGSKRFRWAWSLGLASEALWVWYSLLVHQPGLLVMTGIYAASYGRNLWKLRSEPHVPAKDRVPEGRGFYGPRQPNG